MFGKKRLRHAVSTLILVGFCFYILRLYLQDNINLYIHPRYSFFAFFMSTIALLVLTGSTLFKAKEHHHGNQIAKFNAIDFTVFIVLVLAIILPPQSLSSTTIGKKSLNIPSYDAQSKISSSFTECPDKKPESVDVWVSVISLYPHNCFEGQPIELTGFVIESPDNPLPDNMYYIGRVVMSCCIIDARPYAIPIQKGGFKSYPKDTWLQVSGRLVKNTVLGQKQLVILPDNVKETSDPSKPYEYINTPTNTEENLVPIVQ